MQSSRNILLILIFTKICKNMQKKMNCRIFALQNFDIIINYITSKLFWVKFRIICISIKTRSLITM